MNIGRSAHRVNEMESQRCLRARKHLLRSRRSALPFSQRHQYGKWRLSWFDSADRRLVEHAGPVIGDLDALTEALSRRLGAPVSFDAVIG